MKTLREIAEEAGVSIRTVRRVMNGEKHVRPEKAERVRVLLEASPYVPNIFARGLRNKRTGIVGVIAGHLSFEVHTKKLSSLQLEAERRDLSTMLALTAGSEERELKFCAEYARFCDGIIFLSSPSRSALSLLRNSPTPFAVADGAAPEANAVSIDRGSGIDQAFREIGHLYERFVFLTSDTSNRETRLAAFKRNTETLCDCDAAVAICDGGDFDGGFAAYPSVASDKRTLAFCYNDRIAAGLLRALHENGVDDPERVGVIGFDNDNFTKYTHKSISTVTQSVDELAVKTLDLLENLLNGTKATKTFPVRTKFINRETTLGEGS